MLFAHLILDVWFIWGVCVRDDDFSYIVPLIRWWQKTVFMSESAVKTFILKETETLL